MKSKILKVSITLAAIAGISAGLIGVVHAITAPVIANNAIKQLESQKKIPFGKDVVYGGGSISFLANIIWLIFFGWEMALGYLALGAVWCITIVGIPVGMQCFKMAKLSLMPFGADVIS